jgi:hypothetical protein
MKTYKTFIEEQNILLTEKAFDFDIKPAKNLEIIDLETKLEWDNKYAKRLGSGVEAVAFFLENTQTVVKIIKFDSELTIEDVKKESTYKYLKEITKEFNSGNPYFPKIYSVRFYVSEMSYGKLSLDTTNQQIFGVVKMERLTPVDEIDTESLQGAIQNLGFSFVDFTNTSIRNSPAASISDFGYKVDNFLNKISSYLKRGNSDFIKEIHNFNPKFAKALIIIRKLIKKYNFRPDLHTGNIMVRLTSVGPQIVITDPLIPVWW